MKVTFNNRQMELPEGMFFRSADTSIPGDYSVILYRGYEIVEDEQGYIMFVEAPDGRLAEVVTLQEAKDYIDANYREES